jgi:hypothetical protein
MSTKLASAMSMIAPFAEKYASSIASYVYAMSMIAPICNPYVLLPLCHIPTAPYFFMLLQLPRFSMVAPQLYASQTFFALHRSTIL